MSKRTMAAIAGAGLLASSVAIAQQTAGTAAEPAAQQQHGRRTSHELTGRVISAQTRMLFVQSEDRAIIPVKLEPETTFVGLTGNRIEELRPGDFVQVAFNVKNGVENVATSVELRTGMGGSGMFQESQPPEGTPSGFGSDLESDTESGELPDMTNPQIDETQKPTY